jgi:hypothetical protein
MTSLTTMISTSSLSFANQQHDAPYAADAAAAAASITGAGLPRLSLSTRLAAGTISVMISTVLLGAVVIGMDTQEQSTAVAVAKAEAPTAHRHL